MFGLKLWESKLGLCSADWMRPCFVGYLVGRGGWTRRGQARGMPDADADFLPELSVQVLLYHGWDVSSGGGVDGGGEWGSIGEAIVTGTTSCHEYIQKSVGDALRVRVVDATGSGLAGEIRQPRGLGRVLLLRARAAAS
mmetsp:Transcript_21025/g.56120  ORF Transcript_21025/g.56120 Transcript_21025/m.56120 type:complete len:139 (-) Transcript_21025:222-638(-)